jgi:hypothetical protein
MATKKAALKSVDNAGAWLSKPGFRYISSTRTDVQRTWLKNGWIMPDRKAQHAVARSLNEMNFE